MIRGLVEFAVNRRVTVLMTVLAVIAFGAVSLSRLTLNLLPDIGYPSLTVQTEMPNAAPGELENLVTKPIEEAVGVLKGLQEIHSVSRAGVSEVILEFGWDADMDMLSMDIREKLDRLVLPDEAEKPIVLRYDPSLDPIIRLALTGSSDLILARYVAEKQVKEALERLEGVASAQIKGGEEEEIQINLDQGKVATMGISPEMLGQILSASNINRPGGSLKSRESQYLVRTLNEYESIREIADLTITAAGLPPVRLGDVAEVVRGAKDREEITRVNGQECVVIEIFKEGDANTVQVARGVEEALATLPARLPKGMGLVKLFDQSRFIIQSIDEVRDALLIGGLFAILILILFLRDWWATVIIATSIPISVIATFVIMYRLGISLNIMSLGGLTLGIGMLVDASIVVLEAIHRRREQGLSARRAAVEGTTEVGGAVIASVLTTIAVFFPIVFVEGIAGELFRDQSLTVTFSLAASLIVSISLIPMLASLSVRRARASAKATGAAGHNLAAPKTNAILRAYEWFLRGALRFSWVTLLIAVVMFAASMTLLPKLGRELIPALNQGEFFFEVTMPEGTSLPATDEVVRRMADRAAIEPGVAMVYSSTGTRGVSGGLSLKTKDENLGQVNVVLEQRGDEAGEARAAEDLRESFQNIPNLEQKLGRPSFFSLKTPIELLFYGEDLIQLRDYTLALKPKIGKVPGLIDVRASLESGNPELNVVFDRNKLARLGLTIREVSETLHSRVDGVVVSRFKEGDRQIDIRLRNRESDRDSVADIENIVVAQYQGAPVTLQAIADMDAMRGPAEIHRIGQSRVAILSADLSGRSLGAVVDDIDALLAANPPPPGIDFEMGGQNREMKVSFDSLRFALILAVFLVYLVMAATFENLIHPFIILFTIPFALVGAVLGLYLSGTAISVIALIGVIFLTGVVVNNAIVLIDAVNRARRAGQDKLEAIVHAAKVRMRPILMTTLTTVLGLLPMAFGFGEGAELRQPLAIVVIAGLVVSTMLTLVVVPASYLVVPSRVANDQEDQELEEALAAAERLEAAESVS